MQLQELDKCYPSESEKYLMLQMHVTLCDNRLKINLLHLNIYMLIPILVRFVQKYNY